MKKPVTTVTDLEYAPVASFGCSQCTVQWLQAALGCDCSVTFRLQPPHSALDRSVASGSLRLQPLHSALGDPMTLVA